MLLEASKKAIGASPGATGLAVPEHFITGLTTFFLNGRYVLHLFNFF